MGRFKQFHDPKLSIWQAAVEEVAAQRAAGTAAQAVGGARATGSRPDTPTPMMADVTAYCQAVDSGQALPEVPPAPAATEGIVQTAGFCSLAALKLARAKILGDQAEEQKYQDVLVKFGGCDPGYVTAAAKYAEYFVAQGKQIPYIVYKNLGDFVIDGKLPANARVAVVGDWGTGQDSAKLVLKQIAGKSPDVVIHLGDIYYAGTQFEVANYFLQPWRQILNLAERPIPTFTLSGNHDMYSGGVPYYQLIQQMGQPASYFCLRNANWQFVAVDTGYNDHNPSAAGEGATFLQDTEVAWLEDKITDAGGRRTILLSHHQLFTAFDAIDQQEINLRLYAQVSSMLPQLALWLWGHEHNFVAYGAYKNVARSFCLGHGAFPMGTDEVPVQPKWPDVPLLKNADGSDLRLGSTNGFFNHGYAIIDLDGASGVISCYQDSDEDTPMFEQPL